MNAFVKKEIRLLLPNVVVGCALSLPNLAFHFASDGSLQKWWWFMITSLLIVGIAIMMALSSFGEEISSGTFSHLLSQPISRKKIWNTKVSLLAISLLIVAIFWSGCGITALMFQGRPPEVMVVFNVVGLFGLVIFSGGLWTVLLLRQVAAAFWFTVLVPAVLLVLGYAFIENELLSKEVISIVLVLYSLAGFFFARRLFLRAQDVSWTGGAIVMPEIRGLARFSTGSGTRRWWRPRVALLLKELQLHQSQFVIAGGLVLLHLGVIITRKLGKFGPNSTMELVLESFCGLWLIMPMMCGCAAAAEERKLGTLAGQLCLPARQRTQFIIKTGVVLLLSLLFGVAMPLLLEGTRILPGVHLLPNDFHFAAGVWQAMNPWQHFLWTCFETINFLTPLLTLACIVTAIGLVSFYASTLARNTLQALAPAVLGLVLTCGLLVFAARYWQGWLIYVIGVPALALTLLLLTRWNFKQLILGLHVWLRNVLTLAVMLALVMISATAIYHRFWEKLAPSEPPHGVARLSLSHPPVMSGDWNTLSLRLPDGRIWSDVYALDLKNMNPVSLLMGNIQISNRAGRHFYDGSNWVAMVDNPWRELAGIKTDGTLWVSTKLTQRQALAGGGWKATSADGFVQVGNDTNWSSLTGDGRTVLLVKSDGTLWRWGATYGNNKSHKWPGLATFTPQQVGNGTNWMEVFQKDRQVYLRKTDGTIWTTTITVKTNQQTLRLERGFAVERVPHYEAAQWRSTAVCWTGLRYVLGIRDDGTFRIRADQHLQMTKDSHYGEYVTEKVDLQFGQSTNWLTVAGRGQSIVTLRDNGTLWLWDFRYKNWHGSDIERKMLATKPVRLGIHSDWVTITSAEGGIISLAADGSLWYWPLESATRFMAEMQIQLWDSNRSAYFQPLLDISRKPQFLGNIFGQAN